MDRRSDAVVFHIWGFMLLEGHNGYNQDHRGDSPNILGRHIGHVLLDPELLRPVLINGADVAVDLVGCLCHDRAQQNYCQDSDNADRPLKVAAASPCLVFWFACHSNNLRFTELYILLRD